MRQFTWVPGILYFFLLENPHAHKILRLRGGGRGFFENGGGGGSLYVRAASIYHLTRRSPLHLKGAQTESESANCELKHWNLGGEKLPNSRFALHGVAPP